MLSWAAALGGSMAFASACGSGDEGGGGAGGLTGSAAISGLQSIVTAAPFAIAAKEFYAEASVKLTNVHISGGTDTVRSIMGKSPVGSAATVSSIIAYQAGATKLRIIAGGFNAPSVVFVGKSGSDITRDKELSGKKIGIAGTGSPVEFFAKLAITKAGYTPRQGGGDRRGGRLRLRLALGEGGHRRPGGAGSSAVRPGDDERRG